MSNEKLKISFFMVPLLTFSSGAGKYFMELAHSLSEKKEDVEKVDVITLDEGFFKKFARLLRIYYRLDFFGKISHKGLETTDFVNKTLGESTWRMTSLRNLRKVLNEYDVIYTKNELIELIALKLIGYKNLPPVIVGVHTPLHYPVEESIHQKIHNFFYTGILYKFLITGCEVVHLSNSSAKNFVTSKFGVSSRLIYYPFSVREIQDNAKGVECSIVFDKSKINIAFTGRITAQKGIEALVQIVQIISNDESLKQMIMINIFGKGDLQEVVEELAHEYEFIQYYGYLPHEQVPNMLQKQDIFISTAKWETLPFNILEAQALGLPVVAFNIPGPLDIIENGKTGFLVNSISEFNECLKILVIKPHLFEKDIIIENITKRFKPEEIHQKLFTMFCDTVNHANKGRKKLNFGCGRDLQKEYENVDITSFPGVDKTFDFNIFPYPYEDNEFDEVYADNVLEHLSNIPRVMQELHRITRDGGKIRIIVPHYHCYGAYNDVTHQHYFSHLAFMPFITREGRANYFIQERFALQKIKLVPTILGKLFPEPLRKYASYILGHIYHTVDVTLIVEK